MTGVADGEGPAGPGPDHPDADATSGSLGGLAARRGYVVRGERETWLEWSDSGTPPAVDPLLAEAFGRLRPFEPFGYPVFPPLSTVGEGVTVPEPTFLSAAPGRPSGLGVTSAHTRELAAQLDTDGDHRAAPSALGWLIAYRDALSLDLHRCAARLEPGPYWAGSRGGPVAGALAVIKVWLAEAALARGSDGERPNGVGPMTIVASTVWESFKRGGRWGDDDWATSGAWHVGRLRAPGLDRAVVASVLRGLAHHALVRDRVTDQGHEVWARLRAAESVLHAALRGTPMNGAWVEAAVRRQQDEEAQRAREVGDARARDDARAQLRETLLDPQRRLGHIMETFHPAASVARKSRSVWADTHALFVEAWAEAGLPEDRRPYPTPVALKNAVTAALARDKKRGA